MKSIEAGATCFMMLSLIMAVAFSAICSAVCPPSVEKDLNMDEHISWEEEGWLLGPSLFVPS